MFIEVLKGDGNLLLLLFTFWIILNGKITLEIILFGIFLTAGIGLISNVLFHYTLKKEWRYLKKAPLFVGYVYILLREIVLASLQVMKVILSPEIKIEPALVKVHSGLKTEFGNFILANSITMTPGTITVSVDGDEFTVHCLSGEYLDISTFVEWIQRLEA